MAPTTMTMRPGILVSLRTNVHGGVRYDRIDKDEEHDGTTERVSWETTKTIDDVDEFKAATEARGKMSTAVRRPCVKSAFGLLCPSDKEDELDAGIAEARAIARDHNETHSLTQVDVYVLKGRIASTDEEAASAIASEVRGLLDDMERGVRAVNVKAIRDAATKAKQMGAILDQQTSERVGNAVKAARDAARRIVKAVADDAKPVVADLERLVRSPIESARVAFIDMDMDNEPPAETMPAVQTRDVEV